MPTTNTYLGEIDLRLYFPVLIGLNFNDPLCTWANTTLLLENALCLWRDIVHKQSDELGLLCRGRKVDIVEQQDPTQIRDPQRRRVEIRLEILIVRVHCCAFVERRRRRDEFERGLF